MRSFPPQPSFSTQLVALWGLVALLCGVLLTVVWTLTSSAESRQIALARQQARAACDMVVSRYERSTRHPDEANVDLMHAVLDIALARSDGIEGGFWSKNAPRTATPTPPPPPAPGPAATPPAAAGFLAYAFPTYQGSGIKRDVPEAETPLILRALTQAASTGAASDAIVENTDDAVIAVACPVHGEASLFVWMLSRAHSPLGRYGEAAAGALVPVLAVILALTLFVALALRRWNRRLNQFEQALSASGEVEPGRHVAHVGERDLDRLVDAFNRYVDRAEHLQNTASQLTRQLAQAERFGALGKLAAQVAHEIRNPVGAMRLKAENALAGDSQRQQAALRSMLDQLERIESQVASLLALTQPVTLQRAEVRPQAWLRDVAAAHAERAAAKGIALAVEVDASASDETGDLPVFDSAQLARALDNLILNALRHAPPGGHVQLRLARERHAPTDRMRLTVSDDGPGVAASERERIFEPFVTGRPEGSGLGLAVVREIASAHLGHAWLDDGPSTRFVIDIPWRPS